MDLQDKNWGRHILNWAEIQEPQGKDGYRYVLDVLPQTASLKLLDIGCGTGCFCRLATDKGIAATGIDASKVFIDEAKLRSPSGSFFTGNMEALPFEDKFFDVVCGFNSFQYAADLGQTLRETKRVLKSDGRLIILLWGNKASCEIATFLKSVHAFLSFSASAGSGAFALSENRLLEDTLIGIGFSGITTTDIPAEWNYPDAETAVKGLLSLGAFAAAIDQCGIEKVQEIVLKSLVPYKQPDGAIAIKNQYRIVVCENR